MKKKSELPEQPDEIALGEVRSLVITRGPKFPSYHPDPRLPSDHP